MLIYCNKSYDKQKGIGLLELMLGLTVVALIVVMASRYFTSVDRSQQANDVMSDLMAIVAAADKWVIGRAETGFEELTFEELNKANSLPAHLNETVPTSAFGFAYVIIDKSYNGYTIRTKMFSEQCAAIANLMTTNQETNLKMRSGDMECDEGWRDIHFEYSM